MRTLCARCGGRKPWPSSCRAGRRPLRPLPHALAIPTQPLPLANERLVGAPAPLRSRRRRACWATAPPRHPVSPSLPHLHNLLHHNFPAVSHGQGAALGLQAHGGA